MRFATKAGILAIAAMPSMLRAAGAGAIEVPDVDLLLPLILVGVGIFLLLLEAFVLPGFGVSGFAGLLITTFGLFLGIQRIMAHSTQLSPGGVTVIGVSLIGAIGGCAALCLLFFRLLPVLPGVRRVMLNQTVQRTPSETDQIEEHLIGQAGIARTDLRPAGKVAVNGRTFDVTTPDGFVNQGEQVYVEKVAEGHLVVRRVEG